MGRGQNYFKADATKLTGLQNSQCVFGALFCFILFFNHIARFVGAVTCFDTLPKLAIIVTVDE